MKRFLKINLAAAVSLLVFSASAWSLSYPVAVGEKITMLSSDGPNQYEGHYQYETSSGKRYGTFCLELNEYFSHKNQYTVSSITNYAENGGIGGKEPGTTSGTTQDPISNATKWLFGHFLKKDIEVVTKFAENDFSLQLAFWKLEDELESNDNYYSKYYRELYDKNEAAKAYYDAAILHASEGSAFDVMVMNLQDGNCKAQSQLVGAAPVPEPSTFILLGAGLLGAGLYRRKTKK